MHPHRRRGGFYRAAAPFPPAASPPGLPVFPLSQIPYHPGTKRQHPGCILPLPPLGFGCLRCCLFQRLYKRRAAVGADGVAVLIFCFTVWTPRHRTRPPYLPDRYSSIPFAPAFPAPIARITVAAPVTASPPAKTAALLV